jgi:predicted helicase
VRQYQQKLERLVQYGGSRNETSVRAAFQDLLRSWAVNENLELVPELAFKASGSKKIVIPDGTLKDAVRLSRGYWESKDESDTLEDEIQKKFAKGYPKDNIVFEDTQTAVLIQHGEIVMQASMDDDAQLNKLLELFFNFEPPELSEFKQAVELFKTDLPDLLEVLRQAIANAAGNKEFKIKREAFVQLCQNAMNPAFNEKDAGEMLIQHILTGEIFKSVFDNSQYFEENNIAKQLEHLSVTFYKGEVRRNVDTRTKTYYGAIKAAASQIADHHEKQKFLKVLYETFYRAYNPAGADKLGIFYTPNEIVRFMIEATDTLLERHFNKGLADKGVEILDPATGTGTFITEIIEYLPKNKLEHKYATELHCNELALLPYYIANLNIEATYAQKMGAYKEFQNIVLVDTLDNTGFGIKDAQGDLFTSLTEENLERIQRQNKRAIHVVIGNPPYRANQQNENDNNKNREYEIVDQRIKETYIAASTAQKTKAYDMYTRFLRWATDRLQDNGIVAFVSNNSFIDAKTLDGFRKIVCEEFNDIYVINMKGNANTSGETRQRQGGNVFNDLIKVGVAIYFLVKRKGQKGCKIHYIEVPDFWGAEEKKAYLKDNPLSSIEFEQIRPDAKYHWLGQTENDWDDFIPIATDDTKNSKRTVEENAIFKLYSLGVSTNRDEWVFDLDSDALGKKMRYFIDTFNNDQNKVLRVIDSIKSQIKSERENAIDALLDLSIKWSSGLKANLLKWQKLKYSRSQIVPYLERPYCLTRFYGSKSLSDRLTANHTEMFGSNLNSENVLIAFDVSDKPFSALASKYLVDLHFNGDSQCLPLYRYDNGNRLENITNFALNAFREHYKNKSISQEQIFHYVYAVLHHPAYREKYALNLRQEFPRIPYYDNFKAWADWGKKLLTLHLDFETAKPYNLKTLEAKPDTQNEEALERLLKAKLRADKDTGEIVLDGLTTLRGIPPEAWAYKLGNRSALEWILERYKESTPKDPTIRERFNTYRFRDYKDHVIDLLKRVCTVSLETMKIVQEMPRDTI